MSVQPDYSKILDPIEGVTSSIEALLEGAFGSLMGDQREELKRVYTAAWGLHTLFMDVVSSIGIEDIATRSYLRQKFDSFLIPLTKHPRSLLNGMDGPLSIEQREIISYLEQVGMQLRSNVEKLWLYSGLLNATLDYPMTSLKLHDALQPLDLPVTELPVDLEFLLPENLPLIRGNTFLIRLCVHEIVENALNNTREGYVRITTTYNDHHLTLSIEDSGSGISERYLKDVMIPFFKISNESSGIGLGLSVATGLMVIMDGDIDISSEAGKGTTVRLHFLLGYPD